MASRIRCAVSCSLEAFRTGLFAARSSGSSWSTLSCSRRCPPGPAGVSVSATSALDYEDNAACSSSICCRVAEPCLRSVARHGADLLGQELEDALPRHQALSSPGRGRVAPPVATAASSIRTDCICVRHCYHDRCLRWHWLGMSKVHLAPNR